MAKRSNRRRGQRFARSVVFGGGIYTGRQLIKTGGGGLVLLALYAYLGLSSGSWRDFWWVAAVGVGMLAFTGFAWEYYERKAEEEE